MIRFTVEIAGEQVLNRSFNRVEKQIDDFRTIWPNVAQEIYQIEDEQFASQGAKGASGRWPALSPAYAKFKAKKYPSAKILEATGSLFEALTNSDAPGAIYIADENQLTLGVGPPYKVHQTGTRRMPARPPFSFTEDSKRRIQKSIQRPLVQFIRQQGFET